MNTKNVNLKVGNMRTEQEFILYPYDGGDTINLQSDQRWITANLRTGEGQINDRKKYKGHAGYFSLAFGHIDIKLPDNIITELQAYLWKNEGKTGNISGVMLFENKELFSA